MYKNIEAFLKIYGGHENLSVRRFESYDEAKEFHSKLMKHRHINIGFPSWVSQVADEKNYYFVAMQKHGASLKQILTNKEKKFAFYDFLRTVLLKKVKDPQIQEWKNKDKYVKIGISQMYREILSDLIKLNYHLKEAEMLCLFTLDSVTIENVREKIEEDVVTPTRVTVSEIEILGHGATANGREWMNLINLINDINSHDFIGAFSVVEMKELTDRLQNRDVNGILEIPIFWDTSKRIAFICSLSHYLKHETRLFWDPSIEEAFGANWVEKVRKFENLYLLFEQHNKKQLIQALSLNPLTTSQTPQQLQDANLRNCLHFIRRTFEHFNSMKEAILDVTQQERKKKKEASSYTSHKKFTINDEEELQGVFEYVFPNHIQLLASRVKQLGINI